MSALPSTSSSSFIKFTYDVFLNFRGTDTRHGFTGNLFKALYDRGFRTFFDDEELRKGEEITPSLVKAIQESRIAITVFSKNYASSSFCLDELVKIMECFKEQGRSVLPVFYDVDPCDVRHQRGTYGEALAQGRFKDDKEKVRKWREALHQAANLSGDDFKLGNDYEYVFIEKITKEVSKIISRVPLEVAKHPIGLASRVQEVESLLKDEPNDRVHMVGIFGIGGIGKSTLARAVYNLIANRFYSSCFLSDVREDSINHGLVYLQEKLLSKVLGENNIKLGSVHEGIQIIKQRLQGMKVLLVLDNVDSCEQLDATAGAPDWFGPGSRVIITTRGRDLLINHEIERNYEVKCLNEKQSLELFNWNAFKYDRVDPSFTEVINQAITYASGLPLALEVIGSNLFRKTIKAWKSALDQYKRIPNKKIQNILKVSFDALDKDHQKIFLDIACCLKGFKLKEIEEILHAHYGVNMDYGINMLVEKSLMKIELFDYVTLHDLIQDMGREIVRQESPEIPGNHSRLWVPQEIVEVLINDTRTGKIEMINLEFPLKTGEVVEWNRNAFRNMQNLKTLIISGCLLAKEVEHLPNSLRVLRWEKYPSTSLPPDFHPEKLAILALREGCFESLQWASAPKKFVNMKVLNFYSCLLMKRIPDVSGLPNLEELFFGSCENLIEIHESVGFLEKLRILDACGCSELKSFPPLKLSSLKELDLSYCSSLEKFPEILGKMENVTKLELHSMYSIKEFPYSIRNLTRLREIDLEYCGSFKFPSGILALQELDHLTIAQCEGLLLPNEDEGDDEQVSSMAPSNATRLYFFNCNMPPEFLQIVIIPRFPNAKVLVLECANLTVLPACIEKCHFLRELTLVDCKNLEEMIGIPPNIECLFVIRCTSLSSATREKLLSKKWHEEGGAKMIMLPGTEIPEWFELKRTEPTISFWFRNKFPAISLCFKHERGSTKYVSPALSINDKKVYPLDEKIHYAEESHIYIIDNIQGTFKDYVDGMLSENEWNRVVFSPTNFWLGDGVRLQIGLHIIEERSSMDDIRFTDPLLQEEEHRSVNSGYSQSDKEFMVQQKQQQEANLASYEPHDDGQGKESLPLDPPPTMNDNVNWGPSSKQMRSTTTVTVQGSSYLEELDGAVLDHLENCRVESSQAPSYAGTQDIQVPCPTSSTSSSGVVCGEEHHPKNCCTVFPTTTGESLRNQVEQSQKHVEMESSLDARTHVLSHCHDHSSTTATSEDSKDALKLVQDFSSNVPLTYPNPLKNTKDNELCEAQQLTLLNSNIPTSCEPVEYTEEEGGWFSLPPSLDDVYFCSNSNSDSEPQSLVASHVEQPLDDAYNNSYSVQSARPIHGTNDLPKKCIGLFASLLLIVVFLLGSTMWHWCFHRNYTLTGTKYGQAFLDHPEKAPGESSQVAGLAKTQNTEAQKSTLSSGKISGRELYLNTMLPTTIDESVRDQLEPCHDNAEMEAFYASLDADHLVLSPSHDHSGPSATSEKAKEALKIVQNYIIKDPSFLLDHKQCNTLKTSLDYLSSLSANDDSLSREMRALISEASRMFTHYNRDYIEASMIIESTSSELLKVDELEADLEDNKNQFKEIMALEKELLQKLVYLEESRKELEKKINETEASLSASRSEKSITREKKIDIFEEGKALKTQISEFRKKVRHLQHEQDLARETQAKIKAEWSELGEKFKKIILE